MNEVRTETNQTPEPQDQTTEYIWESVGVDDDGGDLVQTLNDMLWQAVETLALEPYRSKIFEEALEYARTRSTDWMPDEHARESFADYDARHPQAMPS